MPALTAIKAPQSRLNLSAEGPSDAQHLWTVTCTPDTDEFGILNAKKLPRLGQSHTSNAYMTVANHSLTQRSVVYWEVLVQYALPSFDLEAGSNPLLMPPVVNYERDEWEEEISEDINGTPFTNVLGQPLVDGPVVRHFSDRVAVIEKNVATFNQWGWEETVNTDNFMGAPAGYALLKSVTATTSEENGVSFYRRVARVHFRQRGWRLRRLHTGTKYKQRGTDGVTRTVFTEDGVPVLLNDQGFKVKWPSSVAKPPFYTDASYLTWDIYPRGSLNGLRLFG